VIRAVLDTNIAVAAGKSSANSSPNREIISRWIQGQFKLLISRDIAAEYALKLRERGVDESAIVEFLKHLALLADIRSLTFSRHCDPIYVREGGLRLTPEPCLPSLPATRSP
jgi:predicted nucleic acid-binding protein